MTTKTRRGMRRRKRMEFRLVLAAVFCLLLVASFGKLRLQQKNESYRQQEEEIAGQHIAGSKRPGSILRRDSGH